MHAEAYHPRKGAISPYRIKVLQEQGFAVNVWDGQRRTRSGPLHCVEGGRPDHRLSAAIAGDEVVPLNTYAVLLGLGASVGCWQIVRAIRSDERTRWSTFLLLVLLGVLLGARSWYVLQVELFSGQWLPFFALWAGGMYWPGAVLGFVLVTIAFIIAWDAPAAVIFGPVISSACPPAGDGLAGLLGSRLRLWCAPARRAHFSVCAQWMKLV